MAKQWYHWGLRSRSKGGGDKDQCKNSSMAKPQTSPPAAAAAAAGGCMGAVFQLLNSHHLLFRLQYHRRQYCRLDPAEDGRGVQVPRNNLESEVVRVGATASLFSLSKTDQGGDDNNSSIWMGIQISTGERETRVETSQSSTPRSKTGEISNIATSEHANSNSNINISRRDTKLLTVKIPSSKAEDWQSNALLSSNSSGGSRTPGLVARLMGLGPLPEGPPSSPRPSASGNGTRRLSLEGRRSAVGGCSNFNRRLSLQVSRGRKEESNELSRHSCSEVSKRESKWEVGADGNPTAIKWLMKKQVKERVGRRRFGDDMTNKTGELEHRRDECLLSSMRKSSTTIHHRPHGRENSDQSSRARTPSGSLRARDMGLVPGSNKVRLRQKCDFRHSVASTTEEKQMQKPMSQNCRDGTKMGNVRSQIRSLNTRKAMRLNNDEDLFVRVRIVQGSNRKSEKASFSSELLRRRKSEVHPFVPLKTSRKEVAVPKKATHHQGAKPHTTKGHNPQQPRPQPPTPAASTVEFHYIARILREAGISGDARVDPTSHPLDPALFHRLEKDYTPAAWPNHHLSLPCNRRLVFDLVDEILAQILSPATPGRAPKFGFQVMRMVWTKFKRLYNYNPLHHPGLGPDMGLVTPAAHTNNVVAEIERGMVDKLVLDTLVALDCYG